MLNKIIGFSIRNKLIIGLFVAAMAGYGIYETTRLPIDAVPDITNNQVQVITVAPSFGATDIERLVTFPIEQANSNIHGMTEIRSFSRFGLSLVTIVFNDATDIYWARQQVAERLQKVRAQIPPGIGQPELGPITTGLGEIYQYVVRPKEGFENRYDAMQLRSIQDWIVRRQLLGVKGVAEVSSFGGKLKQYEVAVNPAKLQSYGVTIDDVFAALQKNNENTGGSYLEKGSTVLFIRTEGLLASMEDIGNISIKHTNSGTPLFLRDVAGIRIGNATRYGAMCYNDKGEVAGAVVMMLKGANSSEVIKNVKQRIAQIQKTLPEGVLIEPFLDRTKMVNQAIGTVETNLMEGALIVIFILVLFLGNLRAGLLVASVIPLSMLFAVIMMNLFGVSGNLMSLGALDFGLIVDGAVIIVEAVMHRLTHSKTFAHTTQLSKAEMNEQVEQSAGRMMNSAVFGQIIILIVYLPIFTLQGIEGKMFRPMAQTVAFALLGAFILSLTYIPMMSSWVLSRKIQHSPTLSDKWMFRVERFYQHLLHRVLHFPKIVLAAVISLFAAAVLVLTGLGGEFIPALEEGDFAVDTKVLTGSSLSTTIESTQKAAHILQTKFPEVQKVVTKIGSGEIPTDPMPMEASDMMVILKDKKEWTSAKTFPELADRMTKALQEVPGITTGFQFPVQMRFNELMTGARQDVVCRIFGENLDTLAKYAQQLAKIINTVKGSQSVFAEPITGMPQIIINYNRQLIAQYNLSIAEINRVINTAFAGQETGMVFEEEKRFALVVRLDQDKRKSLEDVQNLLIPTPQGTQIPLSQLAEVSIKDGPNQIQRVSSKRRIVVGFNVNGRDVQSIVNELQVKADKQIKLPVGYYIAYGGAFENLNEAKKRLGIAVPVSLLLILVLLYFAFGSLKHGLLIYTAIPLSAIGGIFFLALRGMPFSISAGVGFIALFGVAVLNGIVLIAEFNRLKKEGVTQLHQIVLMGTKVRLRPVLMTAFVASLGFLPMALSNGAGAEVQRPLATVVIGGLLIATLLTLFVLPVLYVLFEKTSAKRKRKSIPLALFLISLAAFSVTGKAQLKPVSLSAAIDTALANNHSVKNEKLRALYQEKLIAASTPLPKTGFIAEAGQMNSIYTDSRFSISQTFAFPSVYSSQKKLSEEEWRTAVLNASLQEKEIVKMVTQLYYRILYLREKQQLLLHADSIYDAFLQKATLRLAKGEANILEKNMAELQKGSIRVQARTFKEEEDLLLISFQLLLNGNADFYPQASSLKMMGPVLQDSSLISKHPSLLLLEQQKNTALAATKVEKTKLLPDITLGYSNTSIRGTGADNLVYGAGNRFSAASLGLALPIFASAQKAKIKAAQSYEQLAGNQYLQQKDLLRANFRSAIAQYQSCADNLHEYEEKLLPAIHQSEQTVTKQLFIGEINYLEWTMLTNQSINTRNNYLDLIRNYNEAVISLQYLSVK